MCEHVKALADESIRSQTEFPAVVGEHVASCVDCSEYVALCSMLSVAGRPPIQMPPVDLSTRIANSTFAKPALLPDLFGKPAVFAPAIGVFAAALWLFISPLEQRANENVVSAPGVSTGATNEVPQKEEASRPAPRVVTPRTVLAMGQEPTLPKRTGTQQKKRDDVKRVADSKIPQITTLTDVPVVIPQNMGSVNNAVRGVDIAAANPVGTRVPEVSLASDPVVDVRVPTSGRTSTGRASLVLASVDEETERDDVRASFQSRLNQQSESFRTANTNAIQHSADSNRINVVNAPVVTGGK